MCIIYIAILLLFVCLYLYGRYKNAYWKRMHIKQSDPMVFVGDNFPIISGQEDCMTYCTKLYNLYPNERYFGFYQMMKPIALIRDPELIKQMGVKDFDNFQDHMAFVTEDVDPMWARNLLSLKGSKWKEMRATLSPTFTGTKMRAMFMLMNETAQQFAEYFSNKNDNEIVLNMKDVIGRYTNDVIANCAFGIKCDSLEVRDNEFYLQGKEATDLTSTIKSIRLFIFFLLPTLAKILKITVFPRKTAEFFGNLIHGAMKTREEQNIIRPDVIHILMEARKGNLKYEEDVDEEAAGFATAKEFIGKTHNKIRTHELTDLDITANCMIFFLAGFDTVSTVMSFAFYEIAMNSDVQEKLHNEIDSIYSDYDGKLTYSDVTKMKYLDMVLTETLRKWPVVMGVDRQCVNKYTVKAQRPEEADLVLNPGDLIVFPIVGTHYDPQYYPDPQKFDPERFNDENKRKINPYTYMPFGVGPRNCIGSRFALLNMKTLMVHVLSKFDVLPCKETTIPIKVSKKNMNLMIDGELKLLFRRRS